MKNKKQFFLFIVLSLLVSAGVFANTDINPDVADYLKGFLENGKTDKEVTSIEEVDIENLPEEILIKDFDETNIGIYEVEFGNKSDKVFVVTYSTQKLEDIEHVTVKSIQSFTFGREKESTSSDYLDSANGVKTGKSIGYVMMRSGSVTGISTSLSLEGEGKLHIKLSKNGVDSGFMNTISSGDSNFLDYDIQSEDIVKFESGDILSVYVEQEGDVTWSNVITSLEVTNE